MPIISLFFLPLSGRRPNIDWNTVSKGREAQNNQPTNQHQAYFLTLKAPITTAADDIHKYFSLFLEKIRLDVSSESSAKQRIHMKKQA